MKVFILKKYLSKNDVFNRERLILAIEKGFFSFFVCAFYRKFLKMFLKKAKKVEIGSWSGEKTWIALSKAKELKKVK